MSYREALEAAGARVIEFGEFGSYQGDWWALVYFEGEVGWVGGSHGSCSGCDSFHAEFGYETPDPDRLAEFGRSYMADGLILSQEEALVRASRDASWDAEGQFVVDFIEANDYRTPEPYIPEFTMPEPRDSDVYRYDEEVGF